MTKTRLIISALSLLAFAGIANAAATLPPAAHKTVVKPTMVSEMMKKHKMIKKHKKPAKHVMLKTTHAKVKAI